MALEGEYQKVTPSLQSAIRATPIPKGMEITSLIGGPHVPNSAHFQGRAVDVSLPHTSAAYDWLVNQIDSGRWKRIGTTYEAYQRLSAYAASKGVTMFPDEGTGSHAHLEVGP